MKKISLKCALGVFVLIISSLIVPNGLCQFQLLPGWPAEISTDVPAWSYGFLGGCSWSEPINAEGNYYLCAIGFQTDPKHGIYLWDRYADSISGWPVHDVWGVMYSPAAGDIDNDGKWEIVAVTQWRPLKLLLYALELDGSTIPGWPVIIEEDTHPGQGQGVPVLYDLDGDGTLEIIMMGSGYRMSVWNHDATGFPGWPVILEDENRFCGICPAVGDIDLDGEGEIVALYGNISSETDPYPRACVFNADGTVLEGWPVILDYAGYSSSIHPVIADFDGDAYPDILFATPEFFYNGWGSYLYLFNEDGSLKNGWPVSEAMEISGSPVAADIDMDGLPEIVAPVLQQPDVFLTAYESNGEYVEDWNGATWTDCVALIDPVIADIQGDDRPEILCTTNVIDYGMYGYILGLDNMGNLLEWSPLKVTGFTGIKAPAVFDIYPTGEKVLLVASDYTSRDSLMFPTGHSHFSYMYGLGPDEDFAPPEWPRFAHDPQNTCNYHHPLQTSVGDGDDEQLPRNLRLYNYPNPFNARTNIILDLPRESEVEVEVFNIYGQRIEKLIDERLEAGNHTLQWDAVGYASGVYFYKLTTSKVTLSRKMVMVK